MTTAPVPTSEYQPTGKKVIVIAIGPVQEFIAAARRSRDLWFGSYLLSELAKAVAKSIRDESGGTLIFPAPSNPADLNPGSDFNVANHIVAEISADPKHVADTARAALNARLDEIRDRSFKGVWGKFDETRAKQQLADLVEFYWTAAAFSDNYDQARKHADAAMAARKATRDFARVECGAAIPKSSLDGQRESVIPEDLYPKLNDPEQARNSKLAILLRDYGIRAGEQLSGVDLLKRRGRADREKQPKVASTSDLAARSLLAGVDQGAYKNYAQQIHNLTLQEEQADGAVNEDGEILFEERLAELIPDEQKLEKARRLLENFLRDHAQGHRPNPYYAILHADGDRMGKVIGNQKDPEQHQKLSAALAGFAKAAEDIVEEAHGSLIYSGGDDVLALLPLHCALGCVQKLTEEYSTRMKDFAYPDPDEDEKEGTRRPTLSAGLAIVHHLERLSVALDTARNAEKAAKKYRDALAITLDRRGGSPRTVAGEWGYANANRQPEEETLLYHRLTTLITLYHEKAIPTGVAYELLQMARLLGVDGRDRNADNSDLLAAAYHEARRILQRKRTESGQPLSSETLNRLQPIIEQLYTNQLDKEKLTLDQLANELIIAQAFAHAEELAKRARNADAQQ